MVQVLDYVPTPLQQLAPYLEQAGANIGGALQRRSAMRQLQSLFQPPAQATDAGGSPQPSGGSTTPPGPSSLPNLQGANILPVYQLATKAVGPEAAKTLVTSLLQQQKMQDKEKIQIRKEQRDIQNQVVQKSLETGVGQRDAIRKQRQDLNSALSAVQSGDVSGFDRNFIADTFGLEPLKTASGVQLQAASKNLLVDTLSRISGRPNQWIDQQIFSASPSIGKSREANETLIAGSLTKIDIDEKVLDAKDELVQSYIKQGIPIPSNIDQLAEKIVRPYAELRQDKLAYDLRVLFEREKGENYLKGMQKVPKGTPLTPEKRDALMEKFGGNKQKVIETAEKLGYSPINPAIFELDKRGP